MPIVNANGVDLHTQVLGSGPSVVMVHGLLTGSLATWYYTAAPALANDCQVLLYDLRGHGRSERVAAGYDVDTMVADLEALLPHSSDTPVILVGHSYGALIALQFALKHPGRVDRLVLVELPLPPSKMEEITRFVERDPVDMVAALPESMQQVLNAGPRRRRATRLLEGLRFLTMECSLLKDLVAEEDVPDDALQSVQCPVLGVFGSRSSCLSVGDRLGRLVADYRQVTLEGGHYLPLEAASALTESIVGFVRG